MTHSSFHCESALQRPDRLAAGLQNETNTGKIRWKKNKDGKDSERQAVWWQLLGDITWAEPSTIQPTRLTNSTPCRALEHIRARAQREWERHRVKSQQAVGQSAPRSATSPAPTDPPEITSLQTQWTAAEADCPPDSDSAHRRPYTFPKRTLVTSAISKTRRQAVSVHFES